MADDSDEWNASSNNAVHISLVVPGEGGPKTIHSFNPKMTYSIFGDNESIFGYQGLKINLRYNACDMRPGLQITYSKKFKAVGETEAQDLKAVLEPYLQKTAFAKSSVFDAAIAEPSYQDWTPPGELWKTIQSGDKTFQVWRGSLADPAVRQTINRIQILIPFFIEGGTFIETDGGDPMDRWTVFFLYEKKKTVDAGSNISPYVFMGYCTVYRYFYYQTGTKKTEPAEDELDFSIPETEVLFSTLPCRSRISQFLILPPFQGNGIGSRFYNAIFDYYLSEPQTLEITVEDPNEAFDDLRDLNDLARLRLIPEFSSLRINISSTPRSKGPIPNDILPQATLDSIRQKIKIAPRQFARVVEMQLLSLIPISIRQSLLVEHELKKGPNMKQKEKEYRLWQLLVKKRLYKHNRDTLIQLDRVERIEKLEQALGGVEADYARLLREGEKRVGPKPAGIEVNGKENGVVVGESSNGGNALLTVVGKGKGKEIEGDERASREVSVGGKSKRSTDDDGEEDEDERRSKKVKFA